MVCTNVDNNIMYVGIDPGKKGAIVYIDNDGKLVSKYVIPIVKSSGDIDIPLLCDMIGEISLVTTEVWLEQIHAIFKTSKGSMFTMGRGLGNIEAALYCKGLIVNYVRPKTWQKEIWLPEDIVWEKPKKKDTKATSVKAAQRLFPGTEFLFGDNEKKNNRRSKPRDGIADAMLIALYGKQQKDELVI